MAPRTPGQTARREVEPEAYDSEAALLERLRAGDEAALRTLVDRLYPVMRRLAGSLTRDPALARDLVQETWAAVLAGLDAFEGRSALRTWILGILVNQARSAVRKQGRLESLSWLDTDPGDDAPAVEPSRFGALGTWSDPPRPWGDAGPEGTLIRRELREVILRELEHLPEGQRAVVGLRDIEGLGSAEVCEALGISEANQRVLLHRGRSRLRAAVERALAGGRT